MAPSVREMGALVQVNPNTVLRAYDFVQQKGIVFNKRGIGYFVEDKAIDLILELRREEFFESMVPQFFKTMKLLRVTPEELMEQYTKLTSTNES
jgi:GntR family transcriptional regulator